MRQSTRFSGLRACFHLLSKEDRKKLIFVSFLQVMSSGLDLVGIGAIGLLGALAVNGVSSQNSSPKVSNVLKLLHLGALDFQVQIAALGILATLLLICKTLFSVFFTRFYLFFLSKRSSQITSELVRQLLTKPVTSFKNISSQELLFGLSAGVNAITMGIIASCIMIVSDLSLLVVMILALIAVDVAIAISTVLLFSFIGLILYWLMQRRAIHLGSRDASLAIKNNNLILEIIGSYREIIARNRRSYYDAKVSDMQSQITHTRAELTFLPNVGKYVLESSVVLGALAIAAVQFSIHDASHAVATLAVFMAAGSRIAPAVLRIQQSAIALKSNLGVAGTTLNLVTKLNSEENIIGISRNIVPELTFSATVLLQDVHFRYPDSSTDALSGINLNVTPGMQVAIVGGSGAGKSTLVDLMLGLLTPTSGEVSISGLPPALAAKQWEGMISYLPQTPFIANGSISENVSLGFEETHFSESDIALAWKSAQLETFLNSLPNGSRSPVGEFGGLLSGGQRQRIGLARALLSKPKLLILDEATSSLDAETETEITKTLGLLRESTTVIIIAHQLRTIRNADLVVFLNEGKMVAQGTFNELVNRIPEFERIVQLSQL